MRNLLKKYLPIIVLFLLIFISILEETFIGESGYYKYLQLPGHRLLRFLTKGIYMFILFVLGYIGLKGLKIKWAYLLWLYWYILVIFTVFLRNSLDFFFPPYLHLEFLSSLSYISLTPFPYFFILFFVLLIKRPTK